MTAEKGTIQEVGQQQSYRKKSGVSYVQIQ
jgi:hypothetical protein